MCAFIHNFGIIKKEETLSAHLFAITFKREFAQSPNNIHKSIIFHQIKVIPFIYIIGSKLESNSVHLKNWYS